MLAQRLPILTRMLGVVVVGLGSSLPCAAHGGGGHGGGGGHALGGGGGGFHGGGGFRGGFGGGRFFGYPGYYGYPGFFGLGMGLGLGYGLGYGYGGGYGYPYYPYPAAYPVYLNPGYGAPPAAPPVCPVAGQGAAPVAPIRLTDADMLLSIRVPPEAVVRINGVTTRQNGPRREFLSSGLSPGYTYPFVITARWTGPNGQTVALEQRLHVRGGERRNVDFLTLTSPPRDLPLIERAGGP